ncbi:MAG: hypothetical protein B7Y75_07280, partial [Azorhizobium sp. 35-67-5]
RWRVVKADWNTPVACRLQSDAATSLTLGKDLADPPVFVGEHDFLSFVYLPRTAKTLAEWQHAALSIAAFVDLALAATDTLMQVHEAGVIHGGLNPARLLIEPEGRVRLIGFARVSGTGGEAEGDLRLSGADMAYVAPELIRTDPAPVDARTDLYALGVLLYEVLVGTLPITARDLQGWLHAQVAVEAPSTRLARADVPEVIDHILLKLISKDPKQRYQTARALHADFRRVAQSLAATGEAPAFMLARGEFAEPQDLSLPLIGRARERETLAELYAAFRASSRCGIVLVSGEPGAGK